MDNALHFVGFRGQQQYNNAVKVFGEPDFIHVNNDPRFHKEVFEGDRVVFANGFEKRFTPFSFDDSELLEKRGQL